MNLLLDTHIWIWSKSDPKHLGKRAAKELKSRSNDLLMNLRNELRKEQQLEHIEGKLTFLLIVFDRDNEKKRLRSSCKIRGKGVVRLAAKC